MDSFKSLVPQGLKNIYHLLVAIGVNIIYGFPGKKLKVIGVTGTDGKTTTVNLIYHILKNNGFKVAMVSTVNAPGFHTTTPSPLSIQKYLAKLVKEKVDYVILEVTSHALDQNRIWGINFLGATVTNVTHEHLDYHQNYENYLTAKGKLFKGVKLSVLNKDDESFGYLSRIATGEKKTYSLKDSADFQAEEIKIASDGTSFKVKETKFQSPLLGEFNISNVLAASLVTNYLGIEMKAIAKAVESFEGVVGRMEEIDKGQDFRVIVDFAHTPNAMKNVLGLLKQITRGKLIVVFGSAGGRDYLKRPVMGEVAGKISDYLVITMDDPRTESVEKISSEIEEGVKKTGRVLDKDYWFIKDRQEAISFAMRNLAKKGDCVALLGIGHAKSMSIAGHEVPWSDQEAARKALKESKK